MRGLTKIMILALSLTVTASAGVAADGIPHRQVADMLYELAFANRKVYTRDIVQRLSNEEAVVTASEHFIDHIYTGDDANFGFVELNLKL